MINKSYMNIFLMFASTTLLTFIVRLKKYDTT